MATPEQPLVTQADIDAYIAQFQKAQADQAAALAAAQQTGLSDYYVPLYGGADIIPGTTQGILSNLGITNQYMPVYSLLGSENSGAATDATERMQFAPTPGVSYRLIDKNTGQVTTASTPEEIKALTQQANALSKSGGNKANLAIESNQTGNWSPIYTDEPNILMDNEMKLIAAAMLAATGAGALQPGGFAGASGAGAGLGTTASLAPGALSSLPANLAAIQAGANAALAGAGLGTAAGIGAGTGLLAGGGIDALPGIVVTGSTGGSVIPAVGTLAALGGTAAATGGAGASSASGANQNVTKDQFGNTVDETGAIVATGTGAGTGLSAAELAALAALGTGAGAILGGGAGGGASGGTTSTSGSSTTNGTTSSSGSGTGAGTGAGGGAASGGSGVLGTGLTGSQLYNIGSLGASVLGGLLGGGGSSSTGATTPYVSPFGAGPSIGGRDYRVNPNISDYEKYGFGPEATFFSQEYNKLVSGVAGSGYTAAAGNVAAYNPLIGGTPTTGKTIFGDTVGPIDTTNVGTPTTGSTSSTVAPPPPPPMERPAGFTGVMPNQKAGDTQVVDGTTWVYGGPEAGWQMQYTNASGSLSVLPGNGATNVSSLAGQPTTTVNEPYFAQNTANIPGWATTYHGFQQGLMGAGISADQRAKAEQELFGAIQTQPFANAQSLVDYARGIYSKYTQPTLI